MNRFGSLAAAILTTILSFGAIGAIAADQGVIGGGGGDSSGQPQTSESLGGLVPGTESVASTSSFSDATGIVSTFPAGRSDDDWDDDWDDDRDDDWDDDDRDDDHRDGDWDDDDDDDDDHDRRDHDDDDDDDDDDDRDDDDD